MERIVEFSPAWDKRSNDPGKNYGIHSVELRMILKGDKGAVQFVLHTGWYLPHVQAELDRTCDNHLACHPLPADKGYHSPTPRYEGQKPSSEACQYLDGKPCYYDGSGLQAQELYEILLKEGGGGVWKNLEGLYRELFEETA